MKSLSLMVALFFTFQSSVSANSPTKQETIDWLTSKLDYFSSRTFERKFSMERNYARFIYHKVEFQFEECELIVNTEHDKFSKEYYEEFKTEARFNYVDFDELDLWGKGHDKGIKVLLIKSDFKKARIVEESRAEGEYFWDTKRSWGELIKFSVKLDNSQSHEKEMLARMQRAFNHLAYLAKENPACTTTHGEPF
ncbi:hypothetical protein HBN50_12875 [Halobacteriovorax sp. GB3]|uniref:hypothetical protein n=1 Tax=Halobacteriovorax sp. GB3 TaxID=2719615 RepID=UPI00235DFCA3|nr:hypothetical protein [Halobacteriovorax sp. GB3]MDD0853998.1 hypothetical protein [Halobacteriovorax sp. GB3]